MKPKHAGLLAAGTSLRLRRRPGEVRSAVLWAFMAGSLLVGQPGCGSLPEEDGDGAVRTRVLSGFVEEAPSGLYVSEGRLNLLLSRLGYEAGKYSYAANHSSDGTSLRCWNQDRTEAVLLTKGEAATTVETPPWAFLDDSSEPVAWYGTDASDNMVTFHDSSRLFAPGLHLDASGQLFCHGGSYYEYARRADGTITDGGLVREIPIKIAAVDRPQIPLATSGLKGVVGGIYATEERVYLAARYEESTSQARDCVVCEEYARDGDRLRRVRQFKVHPPARVAVGYVVIKDYDPLSGSFLVMVERYLPLLGGPLWYVYDIDSGSFREIGVFQGYVGFLDRSIFDRALAELEGR